MAKEKIDLRAELREHKYEFDLLQKIPCTKEENQKYRKLVREKQSLPEGVYADCDYDVSLMEFYTIYEPDLSAAEIQEYLTYKQLSLIRTIKNCVVFFTVLTVIGLIASFFLMLNGM